jgi:hypothetical protein
MSLSMMGGFLLAVVVGATVPVRRPRCSSAAARCTARLQ